MAAYGQSHAQLDAPSVRAGTREYPSLALEHALSPLTSRGGYVLDLGPAVGPNVAFFSRRNCRLYIADLHSSLFSTPMPADRAEALESALARDLPAGETFDLVLTWDLFNYLEESEVRLLGARLRPACGERTILYSMISTRKEIPDRPARFEIQNKKTIAYTYDSELERPAPQYKEPDLARYLTEFEVESTYLLRNGTQEYLFRTRLPIE